MQVAVFLDRDGVLNRTIVSDGVPHPPARAEDVEILPGVAHALEQLTKLGLKLVVVTNQPDVARGTQSKAEVEAINRRIVDALPIDALYVCYHDTPDQCDCRKPKPGMLLCAAADLSIILSESYLVGDRWSDIVAGQAAGCMTFLVDAPYSQKERCQPEHLVSDLAMAAHIICQLYEEQQTI